MEQAPDLAVQTSIMSDDELVVFMSRYSEEHRDSVARSFIMEVTVFERQREEIYAAAQRQFEAMSVSEKARHYAEVAKDATVGYVSEFADDPLGHSADLAVGAAYFAGDLAVPGGLDAPTRFIRGESTFAQAVADQSVSAGVEMTAGFAMGKVFRVGKRLGSALVKGEKTLAKAVVERIAGKRVVGRFGKNLGESVRLTPYGGPGGGHHIHMKRAYTSHPLYDLNEALCLSNEEMMRLGIQHKIVSKEQQKLCIELARNGKPMTREEMNRISVQSLIAGGAREQLARDIVAKSQWDLRAKGVRNPTDMPWGKKGKGKI